MKWASALSGSDLPGKNKYGGAKFLLNECAEQIEFQLSGEKPDLLIVFVSPDFNREYAAIPALVEKLFGTTNLIGCSAGGIIGAGIEVERDQAIAVMAATLPGVQIDLLHIEDTDLPDLDSAPDAWEKLVKVQNSEEPTFILLPDPFSMKIDSLVQGLDYAFPKSIKLGGLASGANKPGMNALFCQDKVYQSGAVIASMRGNVTVDSVVAQGCRPVGYPMRVTKCHENFLVELDNEPAVNVLRDTLMKLSADDQALAYNSLFLGVVMDEFKEQVKAGDFLIRNILGIEPRSGSLMVGEVLRPERTVQFHLRDAATSADDLRLMLKRYNDEHGAPAQSDVAGALMFSCLGRGKHLYGQPNHDSDCFREYLGEVPLGGFFCNGEIGPVGGTTFLHGYTSSFGLFRAKQLQAAN